jgi:anthraniloyl-CoA monooxygenase
MTDQRRDTPASVPPMFEPYRLRGLDLINRVVVAPMGQYACDDGTPNDWQLVHLGSRAIGGAGLVIAEMCNVAPEGRVTPRCSGLYRDEHVAPWRRVVDFVHAYSDARIGIQLGHAGRKGATRVMWEGHNQPVVHGGWPLLSASAIAYSNESTVPAALDGETMEMVLGQYRDAARRAIEAGFDMLELHGAHGYLPSSFISPLSNQRTDEYGGSLGNRMRFPLRILDAIREAMPDDMPLGIKISASDLADGGNEIEDGIEISRMLKAHGAVDYICASAGGIVPWGGQPRPRPKGFAGYAGRIRREVGIPTMAVGNINTHEEANEILAGGEADLVALARGHLRDPYWTLHAGLDLGYDGQTWPIRYFSVPRLAKLKRENPDADGQ